MKKANIDVNINNQAAKARLEEIEKELKTVIELRDKAGKEGDVTGFNKLNGEAKKLTREFKSLSRETIDVNKVLRDISGASINDLTGALRKARAEMNAMKRTDPGFKDARASVKKLEAELAAATGRARAHQSTLGRLAGGFNKYFGMATAAIASITGTIIGIKKLSEEVAHMDDVYSDVRKTTGLLREEVVELNEEFKKMDTRTSRESLNYLARDAGKLGIEGKKNILDFVDAGNQINVALGEDLGEEAITQIGKMVGVYAAASDEIRNKDLKGQMLGMASAVNEIGASSSASEPYLVQFAGRLGGVAKQAGISMSAILGFGSALDQDMQQVEMSATALQNFIMKVMGDPAKFAKIAGIEVDKFSELLKSDANEAIKLVLKSLNEKGGFQQLIPLFKDMGLDGARAVGVLSALAGSMEKVEAAQRTANQAMIEGTSITNEYRIKNENMQAKLEKARKLFKEKALELGERLGPALIMSTNAFAYFIKALSSGIVFIEKNRTLLISLAVLTAAYNTQLIIAGLTKAKNIILHKNMIAEYIRGTVATKAAAAAEQLKTIWTGNGTVATKLATTVTKVWNAVLRANPIGLVVTALMALVGAVKLYDKYNAETVRLEKLKNERLAETEKRIRNIEAAYIPYQNQLSKVNSLNQSQIGKLKELIQLKLKEAESTLLVAEIQQRITQRENTRTGAWDRFTNFLKSGGFDEMKKRNAETALQNGAKAAAEFDEKLTGLRGNVQNFKDGLQTLNDELDFRKSAKDPAGQLDDIAGNLEKSATAAEKAKNRISELKQQITDLVAAGKPVPNSLIHELSKREEEVKRVNEQVEILTRNLTKLASKEAKEVLGVQKATISTTHNAPTGAPEDNSQKWWEDTRMWADMSVELTEITAATLFDIKRNQQEREFNFKMQMLYKERDAELSNKKLTADQREKIEKKYREKEDAMRREAEMKNWRLSMSQAKINMAIMIGKAGMNTWPLPAIPLMALAAAEGLAQIAVINSSKPQFKLGGYTGTHPRDDQPAGTVHANEFVSNAAATRNPSVRRVLDIIDYHQKAGTVRSLNLPSEVIRQASGFATGGYAGSPANYSTTVVMDPEMLEAFRGFKQVVKDLQEKGLDANLNYQDFKKMKDNETLAIRYTT